jgi:rfaE bifunctional protein nucleotidyltransferase chain/domain
MIRCDLREERHVIGAPHDHLSVPPAPAVTMRSHAMTRTKIFQLQDLARELEASRQAGLKVVHCHGCFDLMHIGHIRHLQTARTMGDLLVVTVTADAHVAKGDGRPVFTEALRSEALAALACVDFVAISPWPTAVETIRLLRPDYYVKGQVGEEPARRSAGLQQEIAIVRELGGAVRFTHETVWSSTALLNAHFRMPGDRPSA